MSITTYDEQAQVRISGGHVELYDEDGDTVRILNAGDALALLDDLTAIRGDIERMAESKVFAGKVAQAAALAITHDGVPRSLTINRDGTGEVRLGSVDAVLAVSEAVGEPAFADYDSTRNLRYESLRNLVTFTVVHDGVSYSSSEHDEGLATALTDVPEPVSA